jgi:hypothetical protein
MLCQTYNVGEIINIHRILARKSLRKQPFGRPNQRWVNNIAMAIEKIDFINGDWTKLTQDYNTQSYSSTYLYVFMAWCLVKYRACLHGMLLV